MVKANVKDRILKPLAEVREAIVDPALMSGYFISSSRPTTATAPS